jgi:F-type H+-transporting ATPase subunit alpha
MLPLGRGQRELIIGDRFTGKTAIAIDAIISQNDERRDLRLRGHWSAIFLGRRRPCESIRERGPRARTICVVAASDAAAGLQWLAPYAACSMAEYFSDRGRSRAAGPR